MAHFRGIVAGSRGETSRLGHAGTGLTVEAQSWEGKVVVSLLRDGEGRDIAIVTMEPHHGAGTYRILYQGPISGIGS